MSPIKKRKKESQTLISKLKMYSAAAVYLALKIDEHDRNLQDCALCFMY